MNISKTVEEYEDPEFLAAYNDYQKKYATTIRESDRVLLNLVDEWIRQRTPSDIIPSVLDIGCSTGNLLLHLKRVMGDRIRLAGGDMAESSIQLCRENKDLVDVDFDVMNITALAPASYDVIIANATLCLLDDEQYPAALHSIYRALKPGGIALGFDWIHEFEQDLEIIEKTASHPMGLRICFRPRTVVSRLASEAGFAKVEYKPFAMPFDLPRPADNAEIITYTRKDEAGARLSFRGTLYQPWCHSIFRA